MPMGLYPKMSFSQAKLSSLDFPSLVPNVEKDHIPLVGKVFHTENVL